MENWEEWESDMVRKMLGWGWWDQKWVYFRTERKTTLKVIREHMITLYLELGPLGHRQECGLLESWRSKLDTYVILDYKNTTTRVLMESNDLMEQ
jgi:hypothetical protein